MLATIAQGCLHNVRPIVEHVAKRYIPYYSKAKVSEEVNRKSP